MLWVGSDFSLGYARRRAISSGGDDCEDRLAHRGASHLLKKRAGLWSRELRNVNRNGPKTFDFAE